MSTFSKKKVDTVSQSYLIFVRTVQYIALQFDSMRNSHDAGPLTIKKKTLRPQIEPIFSTPLQFGLDTPFKKAYR